MELKIDPSDDSDSGTSGGEASPTAVIENIERALENPRIRGVVTAAMRNQGMDPSEFGIDQSGGVEELPTGDTDADGDETLVAISSADDIVGFVDEISAMSPLGDKTQLGTIRSHIEENKEDIEARLRNQ